ncbi:MAG: hypothetical protein ACR2ND_04960, partial [Solirubrobacteraceae bacterium]
MLKRKLVAVPVSLAVLAVGAVGASADTFLIGSTNSSTNQGVNNSQVAGQSNQGGNGTLIINRSGYSPSIGQGATNLNCNGSCTAGPTGPTGPTGP